MKHHNEQENTSLKGTLFSVLTLGGIIAIMWFGIYFLYLQR